MQIIAEPIGAVEVDFSNPLFFRKIVEIERFALRAAILFKTAPGLLSCFDTHPRWLPV